MQLQRNMKNKTKGSLQKTQSTVDAESDIMDNMSLDVIFSLNNDDVSQNKTQISTK